MMSFTPERLAAGVYSLIPPIGSTLPLSLISPVIAVSVANRDRPVSSGLRQQRGFQPLVGRLEPLLVDLTLVGHRGAFTPFVQRLVP